MYDKVHEKIEVKAYFLTHKPWIKSFYWKNKEYSITTINLVTRARRGQSLVFLFSVSNDKGAYELRFDTDSLVWWLEQVYFTT